jgi:hypothetical protein
MPPSKPPPAPHNPIQARIARDIGRVGWTVLAVMPTENQPVDPFAYTVGLWRTFDHPELIITGMSGENSHAVIADLIARFPEKGEKLEARHYEKLFVGVKGDYDGCLREVSDANRDSMMKGALRWNAYEYFPALQIIWPDTVGVFPWEDGYDRRFIQPILSEE